GLLIDSEPFWEEAELKVFSAVGVPLTPEMTKETMGLRVDEVVHHWYRQYPWEGKSQKEVAADVIKNVIELVGEKGKAHEGVHEIIKLFKQEGLPIAIASSSYMAIITAVLEKLQIADDINIVTSAEHEPYGKPHPGVYLTAAKALQVIPEHCLVFEDSPSGVLAAKAARMKCVVVPDAKVKDDKRLDIADLRLESLKEFTLETFNSLN